MELTPFQQTFMHHLGFKKTEHGYRTTYSNPDNPSIGFVSYYTKPGYYTVVFADYQIPASFDVVFNASIHHLRFGIVSAGNAEYQVHNQPTTHFKPAPFMAIEKDLRGTQLWKKGQRYSGIEIFVEYSYLEALSKAFPSVQSLLTFPVNQALLYVPIEVVDILRFVEAHIKKDTLTPLLLEAKVLECLAEIGLGLQAFPQEHLQALFHNASLSLKSSRDVYLGRSDRAIIRQVREMLLEQLSAPPSIQEICQALYINEQKLTSGFKNVYQTTVGNYIQELRLSEAANLLSTTDCSIEEISTKVGYSHPSNFSKAFKKKYDRTPLKYRKFHKTRK